MEVLLIPAYLLGAYLLGAVPFGFLAVKWLKGLDIRQHGSGNIGATNVLRVAGPAIGLPVFALDLAKGLVPVLLARKLVEAGQAPALLEVGCAIGAILGHMYSIYLRGKGGKGVATAAGAIGGLSWPSLCWGLGIWVLVLASLRMVSVASIFAAIAVMASSWLLSPDPFSAQLPRNLFVTAICALVIWKHRANVGRVLRGVEPRVFKKRVAPLEATNQQEGVSDA